MLILVCCPIHIFTSLISLLIHRRLDDLVVGKDNATTLGPNWHENKGLWEEHSGNQYVSQPVPGMGKHAHDGITTRVDGYNAANGGKTDVAAGKKGLEEKKLCITTFNGPLTPLAYLQPDPPCEGFVCIGLYVQF
jgi:hypothetical protein